MSSRDVSFYIVDIFIAIDKIARYTAVFSTAQNLLYDELAWDATIRELEIIGEATKYLLDDELISGDNRRIVDFRNQISHGYFGIDENIVWDVIKNKLIIYKKELISVVQFHSLELDEAIIQMKNEHYINEHMIKVLDTLKKL